MYQSYLLLNLELHLWYMEWQLEDAYSRSLLQKLICGPTQGSGKAILSSYASLRPLSAYCLIKITPPTQL